MDVHARACVRACVRACKIAPTWSRRVNVRPAELIRLPTWNIQERKNIMRVSSFSNLHCRTEQQINGYYML